MNIEEFFSKNKSAALAFSGGVDSAYLLYEAKRCGCNVKAYYVSSEFQPAFEREDAMRLAEETGAELRIIQAEVLADSKVRNNPADRCYYCKNMIFSLIMKQAAADGFTLVMDGTNASDDASDRPGMRALKELKVCSPLRECGLTKDMIRKASREAGLFTWNKPAYACLATRIPSGTEITPEALEAVEASERFMSSLGFVDFRVRTSGGTAVVQVRQEQLELVLRFRDSIISELKKYYAKAVLDLEVRK